MNPFVRWKGFDYYSQRAPSASSLVGSAINLVVTPVLALVYALGLLFFLVASIPLRFRCGPQTPLYRAYLDHLYKRDMWPWEPGYFLFKALEGKHFRAALRNERPSVEFGVDTGDISEIHLPFSINVGCEAVPGVHVYEPSRYGQMINCFIEDNPLPPETYKSVYLIHVVDHILDIDHAFRELVRITAPGGRIYFSGLTDEFRGWYLYDFCASGNVFNNRHLDWWKDLCKRHGLEVEYAETFHGGLGKWLWFFTYPFPNRTQAWAFWRWFYRRFPMLRPAFKAAIGWMMWPLYAKDSGKGLNFMAVAHKP